MLHMIVQVNRCLSIKGAEDVINKPFAFEISTTENSMYFVADTDKVRMCLSGSLQCQATTQCTLANLELIEPTGWT